MFKIYSNQRRMEHFKILHIWKSLNGYGPNLDLEWSENSRRSGKCIIPKLISRKISSTRTLQKSSLKIEGVKIFNALPNEIKTFKGTKDQFKVVLDKFLEEIPDQPRTESLIPGSKDLQGTPSNSIPDWIRSLGLGGVRVDLSGYT